MGNMNATNSGQPRAHSFRQMTPVPVSWWRRLFSFKVKGNAFVEFNNALAACSFPREVGFDLVQQLMDKYKVDFYKRFRSEMDGLYSAYIEYCLRDRKFTQDEVDNLMHLKGLFGVTDAKHAAILQEVSVATYRSSLGEVLKDGHLAAEERGFIDDLCSYLKIPDNVRQRVYDGEVKAFIQGKVDRIMADERLSPDEERDLNILCRNLDVNPIVTGQNRVAMDKMRLMWRIEKGEMPMIETGINLMRGEVCYFTVAVNWYENRRVVQRIRYSGPALRIKIMKGVYWRAGDYAIQPVSQDVLALIDTGTVYLTNKRILFDGIRKNTSIRLNKIIDFTRYSDGVQIDKDTGKSPVLGFTHNLDIFTAMLARAIRDES